MARQTTLNLCLLSAYSIALSLCFPRLIPPQTTQVPESFSLVWQQWMSTTAMGLVIFCDILGKGWARVSAVLMCLCPPSVYQKKTVKGFDLLIRQKLICFLCLTVLN